MQDGQDGERFVSDLSKLAQQYDVPIHGYGMMTKERQLAKDLDRLRRCCRIMNNEDVTRGSPEPSAAICRLRRFPQMPFERVPDPFDSAGLYWWTSVT